MIDDPVQRRIYRELHGAVSAPRVRRHLLESGLSVEEAERRIAEAAAAKQARFRRRAALHLASGLAAAAVAVAYPAVLRSDRLAVFWDPFSHFLIVAGALGALARSGHLRHRARALKDPLARLPGLGPPPGPTRAPEALDDPLRAESLRDWLPEIERRLRGRRDARTLQRDLTARGLSTEDARWAIDHVAGRRERRLRSLARAFLALGLALVATGTAGVILAIPEGGLRDPLLLAGAGAVAYVVSIAAGSRADRFA